jgi:hypothetical protein
MGSKKDPLAGINPGDVVKITEGSDVYEGSVIGMNSLGSPQSITIERLWGAGEKSFDPAFCKIKKL